MSVGLMPAWRGGHFVRAVFPFALLAVTLAVAAASTRVGRMYQIDVGGQGSPQQVFFGTEFYRAPDPSPFIVPIEAVAAVFFVLIALSFVGLGQVMGRVRHHRESRRCVHRRHPGKPRGHRRVQRDVVVPDAARNLVRARGNRRSALPSEAHSVPRRLRYRSGGLDRILELS
jgi:hypothetical protein